MISYDFVVKDQTSFQLIMSKSFLRLNQYTNLYIITDEAPYFINFNFSISGNNKLISISEREDCFQINNNGREVTIMHWTRVSRD